MTATLFVLAVYLSFVVDFIFLPIPSEASTYSMLQQSNNTQHIKNTLLIPMHAIVLIVWLFPLVVALETIILSQSCYLSCGMTNIELKYSSCLFLAGIVTAFLGRAITIAGSVKLSRAQPGILVTEGIYSFSRHPIVTGLHITLIGLMLLTGSFIWLAAIPILLVYFDHKIKYEESYLQQRFGELYSCYRTKTMRY